MWTDFANAINPMTKGKQYATTSGGYNSHQVAIDEQERVNRAADAVRAAHKADKAAFAAAAAAKKPHGGFSLAKYAGPAMNAALKYGPAIYDAYKAYKGTDAGGRRTRGPTAHSLAVKRVMTETGMRLGDASKHVKMHGLAH